LEPNLLDVFTARHLGGRPVLLQAGTVPD